MLSEIPPKLSQKSIKLVIAENISAKIPEPHYEKVKVVNNKVIFATDVSWFELIHAWAYYRLQALVIHYSEGNMPVPGNSSITESIKGYLVPFIVRWLLKIGGGALLAYGLTEGSVTEIVGALLAIVVGIITSLFNHKKALNTPV